MRRSAAITHICICQVSMTVMVLLLAVAIGWVPNPYKLLLTSRVQVCENLAIQLSLAPEEQLPDIFRTLASILVEQNEDILSMGFRTKDGRLLSQTENHVSFWKASINSKDASHMEQPLYQGDHQWGTIEICFVPVFTGFFGMLQKSHVPLFLFIGLLLFVMFQLFLRRVLRKLDPSTVVSNRVKTASDIRHGTDGQNKDGFTDVPEMEQKNKELIELSRSAGMAELAANVLHNIGNILNSVNVSASFIFRKLSESKLPELHEISNLIMDHSNDLGVFLTEDAQGKQLPSCLIKTTDDLVQEHQEILKKAELLQSNIKHLKEMIQMQQSYAKVQDGVVLTSIKELIEDAVRMNQDMLEPGAIELIREYDQIEYVYTDKPLVLHIVINLIRNAAESLTGDFGKHKTIHIRCRKINQEQFQIEVRDNGRGISGENLSRIFHHGFTTKQNGHGFGLHSSALNARAAGGSLAVYSEGEGKGAGFVLTLPINPKNRKEQTTDTPSSPPVNR